MANKVHLTSRLYYICSPNHLYTNKIYTAMSLRLGDVAPNFQAKTSLGEIDFYEYLGDSWGILFSHPADYTPVCTTELGRTAALKDEFASRNTKVLALSVDPVDKHLGWISDINETQNCSVEFPIIADDDRGEGCYFKCTR